MEKTITQAFLDLYDGSVRNSDGDLPALRKAREEAAALLREQPLPHTKSEHYRRFDVDAALSDIARNIDCSYRPDVSRFSGKSCFLSFKADAIQAFMSGGLVHDVSDAGSPEKGYFIGSVHTFAKLYPEVLSAHFSQVPSLKGDPLSQLNTLFFSDVLVIYLKRGTHLSRPIHLLHRVAVRREGSSVSFPRILLIAEEDTEAKLLSCIHGFNPHIKAFQNAVAELYVGERSRIEFYLLEETLPLVTRIHNVHSVQERDSRLLINNLTLQNGKSRSNYRCDLAGEGAELNLDGLAILDGEQVADNHTVIRHSAPRCKSDELFKYTINDEARGSFSGMIYVAKDAQKTEAYQNNRNLLLSRNAKMYSKPQLEIYADDVKCSHGLTTGQLDENGLFYLRQRGIPYQEAVTMMTIAFMGDVIDRITLPDLKERLIALVEDRYRGKHSLCSAGNL